MMTSRPLTLRVLVLYCIDLHSSVFFCCRLSLLSARCVTLVKVSQRTASVKALSSAQYTQLSKSFKKQRFTFLLMKSFWMSSGIMKALVALLM